MKSATMRYSAVAVILVLAIFLSFNFLIKQLLILSAIVLFAVRYLYSKKSDGRLPPGPSGVPILGCLPWFLLEEPVRFLNRMAIKYGGIITVRVGALDTVFLNDYDIMKEIGNHPDFQHRPDIGVFRDVTKGLGIIGSEGNPWKHQRKFFFHAMRRSGIDKMKIEEKITVEMSKVVTEMSKFGGEPMSPLTLLEKASSNVIFGLALNKSFEYDDPEFVDSLRRLNEIIRIVGLSQIMSPFPWLSQLLLLRNRTIQNNYEHFKMISKRAIDEHRVNLDADNPRDLLDLYLLEMSKEKDSLNEDYLSTFYEDQLQCLIVDMFAAGTETSCTTMLWALLYMLHYPEIQSKVQSEIDEVVERKRFPNINDKPNLPFTVATIQEIERLSSVAPYSIPHSNVVPVHYRGYYFPPRSIITFNIYAVHRNPLYWNEPEKFDPMRFINDKGKAFRPPYLIPYGVGRRTCVGESLAGMEVFLFFSMLMQRFKFEGPGGKPPDMIPVWSLVRGPKPYKLCAKPRF